MATTAPYGNTESPQVRVRIVGGKRITVVEDRQFAGNAPPPTNTFSPPPPQQRRGRGNDNNPLQGGPIPVDNGEDAQGRYNGNARNSSSELNPLQPLPPIGGSRPSSYRSTQSSQSSMSEAHPKPYMDPHLSQQLTQERREAFGNRASARPEHPLDAAVGEDSKLIKMIEEAQAHSGENFDLERLRQGFLYFDRENRGTLQSEQIKTVCYRCRLPLQDSIVERIIKRLRDHGGGQCSWHQFLSMLERVKPLHTGSTPAAPGHNSARESLPPSFAGVGALSPREPIYQQPTVHRPDQGMPPQMQAPPPQRQGVESLQHYPPMSGGPDPRSPTQAAPRDPQQYGQMPPQQQHRAQEPSYQQPPPEPQQQQGEPQYPAQPQYPTHQPESKQSAELMRKASRIEDMEQQMRELEVTYKQMKERKEDEKARDDTPWFKRFLKFAEALYRNDTDSAGKLPTDDVRRLLEGYNLVYNLNIPEDFYNGLMSKVEDDGHIPLDIFVKFLANPSG